MGRRGFRVGIEKKIASKHTKRVIKLYQTRYKARQRGFTAPNRIKKGSGVCCGSHVQLPQSKDRLRYRSRRSAYSERPNTKKPAKNQKPKTNQSCCSPGCALFVKTLFTGKN